MVANDRRGWPGVVDPMFERQTRRLSEESGKLVGAISDHKHAARFQCLESSRHVQYRFDPRTHDQRPVGPRSSSRSVETSNVAAAPRCTPPRPPVAKTRGFNR